MNERWVHSSKSLCHPPWIETDFKAPCSPWHNFILRLGIWLPSAASAQVQYYRSIGVGRRRPGRKNKHLSQANDPLYVGVEVLEHQSRTSGTRQQCVLNHTRGRHAREDLHCGAFSHRASRSTKSKIKGTNWGKGVRPRVKHNRLGSADMSSGL